MSVKVRQTTALTRRRLLVAGAASAGLTALGGIARPYLSRAADRPRITHGLQSGDVTADSGVVWAHTDRPARMLVEAATSDSFRDILVGTYVDALPESDFTAKVLLEDLPAGADIFYRVQFQDLASPTSLGEPMVGHFRTAPAERRSVRRDNGDAQELERPVAVVEAARAEDGLTPARPGPAGRAETVKHGLIADVPI